MSQARVIVFGYGELALAALDAFARMGVTPVAVVIPGNRSGPELELVSGRAQVRDIPVLVQPPRSRLEPFLDNVRVLKPDLLFVWSYSMLLPGAVIDLAPRGAINIHGGLLPEYRGGHVMNWAIANGETETGATLVYMDEGIDTGPVIGERRFPLEWRDDAASVRQKLRVAGEWLLDTWWPAITAGTAPRVPQDEARAQYWRMRTADDGAIDWSLSSTAIYNLTRALTAPWPGAFTTCGTTRLVIRRVEPIGTASGAAPGTVVQADHLPIRVATGAGDLDLLAVEINGQPADLADLYHLGLARGVTL